MAYTQQDLQTLERAIASGVQQVRYSDRLVTYQSIDAMRAARQEIANELGITLSAPKRRVFRTYQRGNGYS